MSSDLDMKNIRLRLVGTRDELITLSAETEVDRKPVALDQAAVGRLSRMDAMQRQAMQLETEQRRQLAIARIDEALERMSGDDYGYCVACDEAIGLARLENDPAVSTCIKCASKA